MLAFIAFLVSTWASWPALRPRNGLVLGILGGYLTYLATDNYGAGYVFGASIFFAVLIWAESKWSAAAVLGATLASMMVVPGLSTNLILFSKTHANCTTLQGHTAQECEEALRQRLESGQTTGLFPLTIAPTASH